jgi:hypothetical protein
MLGSSIPAKFSVPFANSAVAGINVRPVPVNPPAQPGAASLNLGFPPINFVPVAAGGIPPFGQDMNGIFQQVTAWLRWHEAGAPVGYDAAFATSIGGYPKGALLPATTFHVWYESLIDNNTDDPNAGGANWRVAYSPWSSKYWTATGSANAQVLTLSPAPTSLAQLTGLPINFFSQGSNTGSTTLNINGLGNVALNQANGTTLGFGALAPGGAYTCVYNGTRFLLTSQINSYADPSTTGLAVTGTGSQGANFALFGGGGTTPNKYIRAFNGVLEFVNNAYSGVIASLTDAGVLSTLSGITAGGAITATTGNVTSTAGRLRAGLGALGSSDLNAATILNDFALVNAGTQPSSIGYTMLPNGFILQWGVGTIAPATSIVTVTFPLAFPTTPISVMINEISPSSWLIAGRTTVYAANVLNSSQAQIIGLIWNTATTSWAASDVGSSGISFRYWAIGR